MIMTGRGLCPSCMQPAEGERCPRCGGELKLENPPLLLPVGTSFHAGKGHSYVLGAVLGQGGFGVTYIGREVETGRRVAVKEYFPTRCSQRSGDGHTVEPLPGMDAVYEGGRYSFVKEARVLSGLEGTPSVVQALAYLEENNTAYLIMEYLDGTPLHRLVDRNAGKRILPEKLFPPLKKLLYDVSLLHEKNIIHRDIAPDNIMWMPDDTLTLLDFGSARSTEDGKSMTVMIKHGFAPVEQYQSRGQGAYTDVYAMAATIYYCLTAVVPIQASERAMALQSGTPDPLKRPTTLGVALTAEEEDALMWALAVLPQDRPQSMGEFARRLFPEPAVKPPTASGARALLGKVREKAAHSGPRWLVWFCDRPALALAAGAAVFAVLLAGAILFWVYIANNF